MSLIRIARIARRCRDIGSEDRGVALASVLIFAAAAMILSAIVAASVVNGIQFSSATRAGVESQASADAGIAVARLALLQDDCDASDGYFQSDGVLDDPDTADVDESEPAYEAQIQYSLDDGETWVDGCPASVSQPARIVAMGEALTPGTGANTTGDETEVEALLSTISNEASLNPSGPAVYSYSTTGFGGSGKLISSGGYDTSIMIRQGDVTCSGAANGAADLVVKSGTFTGTGSCVITGNVWVNGSATLNGGGQIGGSLTAGSVDASGSIGGNVYSDGALKLSWGANVTGWASGASLNIAGGSVSQSAWARTGTSTVSGGGVSGTLWSTGAATASGGTVGKIMSTGAVTVSGATTTGASQGTTLDMSNGTFKGGNFTGAGCFKNGDVTGATKVASITTTGGCRNPTSQSWWSAWAYISTGAVSLQALDASPSKPSAVTVPDWVDFGADPIDLTPQRWAGYTLVTMGTTCTDQTFYQALQLAGDNPALIDTRACSNGLKFSGSSTEQTGSGQNANGFRLHNDTTIIGSELSFAGSSRFFSDEEVNLWLINPDTVANGVPDCNGQSLKVGGGFSTSNVNVMFYTPCDVTISSSQNLKGQIFAGGNVTFGGSGVLDYVPMGIPGYDLDTGFPDGPTYTDADRSVVWKRNVSDAG